MSHRCLERALANIDGLAASDRIDVPGGAVPRRGARGAGSSWYLRYPDGNVVAPRHRG